MGIQGNPKWSKESIEEFLAREKPRYQKISLPHGLSTGGYDRPQIKSIALDDIRGKTLLDVGSCYGGFCIEALQRGASKAVGIELSRKRIQAARTLADMLGLSPDYRFEDIESLELDETFDVTICLDVLHHLRDPIGVLRKLSEITNERLILEVASAGRHDRRKLGIGPIRGHFLSSTPAMLVGPYNPHSLRQTYFFTRSAMKTILGEHRRIFRTVNIIDSEFKDRFIAVAEKIRINRMVLICGLTSSGKSTFRDSFVNGEFSGKIKPVEMNGTVLTGANRISKKPLDSIFPAARCDRVVYHYDISRKETLSTYSYDRDVATDVMALAEELDIVLIAPTLESLQKQLAASELSGSRFRTSKKHLRLQELYNDPVWVESMYRDFIDFCSIACRGKLNFMIYHEISDKRQLTSTESASKAKKLIHEIYLGR